MKFKGEISLLTVALIWGSGFVATDLALGNLTATGVMAIRFVIAAVFIGALFGRRIRPALDSLTIRRGIFLGIFLNLSFLAQTVGLVFTTPSKNAFLTAVNVILVPFIAAIFARGSHKVERSGVIGALLAIVGIGLISLNLDGSVNMGDLLTLLCAVGFAFHIYFTGDFVRRGSDAIALTILQLSTAAILSLVAVGVESLFGLGQVKETANVNPTVSILAAVYLGLLSTGVAFLLQTVAQQWTTQTRAAILMSTESVFGTLMSALILQEQMTTRAIIGSAIVFAAILVAELGAIRQSPKAPKLTLGQNPDFD
ncbi:MAG: DMT family transporter [Clostridia bacterium]|nr:DMT family transporter [Clostridia bacterium]